MSPASKPTNKQVASLQRMLGDHITCRSRLDLLVFWGKYPGGWFSRGAIRPLTRSSRAEIERALHELVDGGIIRCRRDGRVSLYALTDDVRIRDAVEKLPRLAPHERRHLLHQSMRRHGISDDRQDDQPTPRVLRQTPEEVEA